MEIIQRNLRLLFSKCRLPKPAVAKQQQQVPYSSTQNDELEYTGYSPGTWEAVLPKQTIQILNGTIPYMFHVLPEGAFSILKKGELPFIKWQYCNQPALDIPADDGLRYLRLPYSKCRSLKHDVAKQQQHELYSNHPNDELEYTGYRPGISFLSLKNADLRFLNIQGIVKAP